MLGHMLSVWGLEVERVTDICGAWFSTGVHETSTLIGYRLWCFVSREINQIFRQEIAGDRCLEEEIRGVSKEVPLELNIKDLWQLEKEHSRLRNCQCNSEAGKPHLQTCSHDTSPISNLPCWSQTRNSLYFLQLLCTPSVPLLWWISLSASA